MPRREVHGVCAQKMLLLLLEAQAQGGPLKVYIPRIYGIYQSLHVYIYQNFTLVKDESSAPQNRLSLIDPSIGFHVL